MEKIPSLQLCSVSAILLSLVQCQALPDSCFPQANAGYKAGTSFIGLALHCPAIKMNCCKVPVFLRGFVLLEAIETD